MGRRRGPRQRPRARTAAPAAAAPAGARSSRLLPPPLPPWFRLRPSCSKATAKGRERRCLFLCAGTVSLPPGRPVELDRPIKAAHGGL
jgi:hypothetical protein